MNRNFTPLPRAPRIYEENIYLCDSSGKVLASRSCGDENIKNIFELLPESEKSFLRDNLLFYGLKPLALVDSKIGPVFVDCSLFAQFRVVVAIAPRFSKEEIAPLTQNELLPIVKLSPRMKEALMPHFDGGEAGLHNAFCDSLSSIHRGEGYYSFFGKNNAEIAMMMSDLALEIGAFYGADVNVSVVGADDFDIANMPCMTSGSGVVVPSLCCATNREVSTTPDNCTAASMTIEMAIHSRNCVSPTMAMPIILPIISWNGFTDDTITSTIRLVFSSTTPRITCDPNINITK